MSTAEESNQSHIRSSRSMKNILLRPEFQLKYSFYFVGMTLVTMGAVFLLFLLSLQDMISTLSTVYRIEPDVIEAIQQSLKTAGVTTITVTVIFAAIAVSIGIVLTHRLVGPMVPIVRLIQQLKNGEYGVQGRLRNRDDFHEVMHELNSLSEKLAEKYPSKTT
jgi:nitrogen fixation/metabolism regulation signal transduction histidine kinase